MGACSRPDVQCFNLAILRFAPWPKRNGMVESSTFPVQQYVVRTWIIAERYPDGRVLYRQQLADYPSGKWYYVCFGDGRNNPQYPGVPYCR